MSMGPRAAQSPCGAISEQGSHAARDGASSHVTRAGCWVRGVGQAAGIVVPQGTSGPGRGVQAAMGMLGH